MARHFARPRGWRTGVALAAASLAVGTLAACGSSSSSPGGSPTQLTDQTWVVPQDWGAIDPTAVAATNTGAILLVLEPLVLANGNGGVTPNLATETRPSPTTFVFNLRQGVKFSDGHPLTVQDVAYSYQIQAEKGSKSTLNSNFADVTSMKVTGPDQFTIKLKTPDVLFENTVAQVGIVEKSVREKYGNNAGSPGELNVGTGPYVVSKYQPGSELVLKANPNYWGTQPVCKILTLKVIQDDSARLLAVQSGNVTGAFEVPAAEADTYASAGGMKLITGANPSIMMLNVNTKMAPWNDVYVRKAVSMAIDKQGIINAVLHGKGHPESMVVNDQNLGDDLSSSQVSQLTQQLQTPYDVTAAKAELAKSKTPHGFSATVIYSQAESATSGLVAQAVAEELKKIGINLTVKALPDSQYTDEVFFKHTAPASVVDFTTDLADPIGLPNYLTSPEQTLAGGGYTNIAEWTSPAQSKVLSTYLKTPSTDRSTRAQLLTKSLQNMFAAEPYIPIYNADYLAVIKSGLSFNGFDGMWWMRRWINDVTAG